MPVTEAFSDTAVSPRRRAGRRDPLAIQASIYSRWFDKPVPVETSDVSPEGLFLVSELLLEPGERVLITFAVPGTAHLLVADAEVVRVSSEPGDAGMGLAFARLPSIDERILRGALDRRRVRVALTSVGDRGFRC